MIYLLDRACPDVMSAPPVDSDCDTPISAQLRGDLTAALAPYFRAEFSDGPGEVPLGRLNGRGMTYFLSYRDGRWQIAGSTDAAWIS